ncbi:hypothetical protein, partial [Nocardia wallacei]|uniref:hypothetical protein n=1 Tax=Nocardia wallacei TaxID=480035 RepID=UPI0024576F81
MVEGGPAPRPGAASGGPGGGGARVGGGGEAASGAGPGTKGLSLFFVPKFHFDHETGELGERNGVFVTG